MATIASLNIIFRGQVGPLNAAVGSARKTLAGLQKSVMSINSLLAGGAVGFVFKKIVDSAADAERQSKKLESVLNATGNGAGFTLNQMKDYAAQLQRVTTFEDDATVGAMAVLATFKQIKGDVFKDAIAAAMDMSTVLGTDLQSSVTLLGKALNSPAEGLAKLARSGVQFSDQQKQVIARLAETGRIAEAQGKILDGIRERFGGAAQADAQTMAGAIAQMKNAWGDLAETLGNGVAPAMIDVAKGMSAMAAPGKGIAGPASNKSILHFPTNTGELAQLKQRLKELSSERQKMSSQLMAIASGDDLIPATRLFGSNLAIANPFKMFSANESFASLKILQSNIETIDRQMGSIFDKLKRLKESGTILPEPPKLNSGITDGILGAIQEKQKSISEFWDRLPAQIRKAVAQGAELNRIMDQHKEMVKSATDSVTSSLTTPLDDYMKRLGEIDTALNNNKISKEQAKMASLLALQNLGGAVLPDANRKAGAIEFGSREAFSAQHSQPKEVTQKMILEAAQAQVQVLRDMSKKLDETGVVSIP